MFVRNDSHDDRLTRTLYMVAVQVANRMHSPRAGRSQQICVSTDSREGPGGPRMESKKALLTIVAILLAFIAIAAVWASFNHAAPAVQQGTIVDPGFESKLNACRAAESNCRF